MIAREYLELAAGLAPEGWEAWLLRNGRAYEGGGKPDDLEWGTPKECYRNAALAALGDKRLTYCEGVAVAPDVGFPLGHAWLIDEDGNAVDVTWRDAEGAAYFGVPVPDEELLEVLPRERVYGVLGVLAREDR